LQESGQKVSLLSWVIPLAAIVLGLAVVCLIGALLAWLFGSGGSKAAADPSQAAPAFVPASTPIPTGAGMQASSEQQSVETYGGIPLPDGVHSQQAVGSEQNFSVIVQQPFDRVVAFYQASMPEWSWHSVTPETSKADQMVELRYEKDGLTVALVITRQPFVGTVVAVTVTQV
jgi:hypothetical protein